MAAALRAARVRVIPRPRAVPELIEGPGPTMMAGHLPTREEQVSVQGEVLPGPQPSPVGVAPRLGVVGAEVAIATAGRGPLQSPESHSASRREPWWPWR